jgi:hypothetical protein
MHTFRRLREAFDQGGPFRVCVIVAAFVLGIAIPGMLPRAWGSLFLVAVAVLIEVFFAFSDLQNHEWTWNKRPEEHPEHSITLSDSINSK